MWVLVLFDLPVKTPAERKSANAFRRSLIKDGYLMLQFSVYVRICNGDERVEKHLRRIESALPPEGSIRALTVTDLQYERMKCFLSQKKRREIECAAEQLLLF